MSSWCWKTCTLHISGPSSACIEDHRSSWWEQEQLNISLALYLNWSSNLALNLSIGWCISQPCNYHLPWSMLLFFLFLSRGRRQEVKRRVVYKETGKKNIFYNLGCVQNTATLINYTPYMPGLMSKREGRTVFCVHLFPLTFGLYDKALCQAKAVAPITTCQQLWLSQNTLHAGRERCKDKILGLKSIQDSLLHIPTASLTSK